MCSDGKPGANSPQKARQNTHLTVETSHPGTFLTLEPQRTQPFPADPAGPLLPAAGVRRHACRITSFRHRLSSNHYRHCQHQRTTLLVRPTCTNSARRRHLSPAAGRRTALNRIRCAAKILACTGRDSLPTSVIQRSAREDPPRPRTEARRGVRRGCLKKVHGVTPSMVDTSHAVTPVQPMIPTHPSDLQQSHVMLFASHERNAPPPAQTLMLVSELL